MAEPPAVSRISSASNRLLRVAGQRDVAHALHQRLRHRPCRPRIARGAQAFVAFDADQPRGRAGAQAPRPAPAPRSCVRQPVRPPSTPISSSTSKRLRCRRCAAVQASISASCASESTRKATRRPGVCALQLAGSPCRSIARNTWLAMMQRRGAGGDAGAQLRDGREGQAPGAGVELALEQLRRHRGLAVRRQVDAVCRAQSPASSQVVRPARRAGSRASGSGRSPRSTFQPWLPMAERRSGAAVVREALVARRPSMGSSRSCSVMVRSAVIGCRRGCRP